jgi:hypothetical protein
VCSSGTPHVEPRSSPLRALWSYYEAWPLGAWWQPLLAAAAFFRRPSTMPRHLLCPTLEIRSSQNFSDKNAPSLISSRSLRRGNVLACSGATRQMTPDQVRQLRYLAQAKLQQQAVAAGNGNSPNLEPATMGPPGSAATAALLNRNLSLQANRPSPGGSGSMLPPGTTTLPGSFQKKRPTTAAEAIELARSGRLTDQQRQHILQQLQVGGLYLVSPFSLVHCRLWFAKFERPDMADTNAIHFWAVEPSFLSSCLGLCCDVGRNRRWVDQQKWHILQQLQVGKLSTLSSSMLLSNFRYAGKQTILCLPDPHLFHGEERKADGVAERAPTVQSSCW